MRRPSYALWLGALFLLGGLGELALTGTMTVAGAGLVVLHVVPFLVLRAAPTWAGLALVGAAALSTADGSLLVTMLASQPVICALIAVEGRRWAGAIAAVVLAYLNSADPFSGEFSPDAPSLLLMASYFLLAAGIVVVAEAAKLQRRDYEVALLARREALTAQLHDSVARNLTLALMTLRDVNDTTPDPRLGQAVDRINAALAQTRQLLSGLAHAAAPPAAAVPDLVGDLRRAGLRVKRSGPDIRPHTQAEMAALAAIYSEITVNILKYADRREPVVFLGTPRSLSITNALNPSAASTDSTGLGGALMRWHADRIGAELRASYSPTSWSFSLHLPKETAHAS